MLSNDHWGMLRELRLLRWQRVDALDRDLLDDLAVVRRAPGRFRYLNLWQRAEIERLYEEVFG